MVSECFQLYFFFCTGPEWLPFAQATTNWFGVDFDTVVVFFLQPELGALHPLQDNNCLEFRQEESSFVPGIRRRGAVSRQ